MVRRLFRRNGNTTKKEGEQSQEVSDENNISSLLDMCHYSDISSVEDENSPSSGQCEENKDEKEQDNNNGDNFYNSCNCIFCSRRRSFRRWWFNCKCF